MTKPDRLPAEDVLRRFDWSRDQLEEAMGYLNFPRPRITYREVGLDLQALRYWLPSEIATWAEHARSIGLAVRDPKRAA